MLLVARARLPQSAAGFSIEGIRDRIYGQLDCFQLNSQHTSTLEHQHFDLRSYMGSMRAWETLRLTVCLSLSPRRPFVIRASQL